MLRSRTSLIGAATALLAACGGGGPPRPLPATSPVTVAAPTHAPATASPPRPEVRSRKLAADEKLTVAGGATFTASAGWAVEEHPARITLIAPEGDLTMTYVQVKAADRDAAIASAWAMWKPGFALQVAQAEDFPARAGWDAVAQVVYVTPVKEARLVAAFARRKADTWYVALLEGTQAGFDRRNAQLGTAIESLAVPGLDKESFAGRPVHPLDTTRIAALEAFIEEARVATKVPGAAIAIVQGGKIVYEKGFGVRALGKPAKVTPMTRFMIGSVGKSLTTLMIARLVEQQRLGWDTPVVDVLPSFGLGDEATTRAATMRHTACACTGMPRQDLEMIFEGKATPEQRLASMKAMKPTTGFGETFQYSNLMVSAGGFAAAHAYAPRLAIGPAYDGAMQKLVFGPLGMKATTFDFKVAARAEHALPHPRDVAGEPTPVAISAEEWVRPVRPAGGAWSTVHDMARVLLLELGRGKLDGKQVIDEQVLLARRAPQVKITDDEAYGLGLVVSTEYGIPFVWHGGATGGFSTQFMVMPDHGVGMIIVSNTSDAGLFNHAVERRLLELLFDGRPEAKENVAAAVARQAQARAEELARIQREPEPAWFGPLVGAWRAPGLGRIELRVERGKAVLDAGEWQAPVGKKTARDGSAMLIMTGGMVAGLALLPREQDGRTVLVLDAGQQQVVFERVPTGGSAKQN